MLCERVVEPLLAVQLALAPGLEQAVREQHGGVTGLQRHPLGLVGLLARDPERQPAQLEWLDGAGPHDPPAGADGLPTLDDVLSLLAGSAAGVHLDLKSQRAERPVADALRRHGLVERTVVSSFRRPTLLAMHAAEPGLRLGRTYPQDRTGLTKRPVFHPPARAIVRVLRRTLPRYLPRLLAGSNATAAVLYWEVVTEAAVERCHELGAPVLVWTVDDAALLPWLDRIGVDGVITNDPRIFQP